ncbi:MAG: cbb3-type cytochrome c oxidase N-terminal domain-containing protein [Planctomycetota bacterium]
MSSELNEPEEQPAVGADNPLANHTYDGITEYDNPTPFWWNALFIASVLFAPIYIMWFHSSQSENTHADRYQAAFAANMRLQFGELGTLEANEENILKYMDDSQWLAVGQATFITHCASCHGKEGQGISAPNMTDDYYLHVKQVTDIAKVIKNGAKAGAMPAWENRLHPNEVVLAASYVASMRGQNLSSARPAEGDQIDPWPAAPKAEAEADNEGEQASVRAAQPATNG